MSRQAETPRAMSGCGLLFGLLLVLWLLVADHDQPDQGAGEAGGGFDNRTLIYEAQHVVKRVLQSPTSAEFPATSSGKYQVRQLEPSLWEVIGEVDADNVFGAHLRQTFVVHLKERESGRYAVFISIADQIVLDVRSPD